MNEVGSLKTRPEKALARARSRLEILAGRPDPQGLLALIRIIFPGEDISDPGYLPWLYDQNPASPAHEFITRGKGMVTGHIAAVPLPYKIGGETMRGCMAVNAITHPDFRGKGIFIVLHDELNKFVAKTGIEFTFGYANINSYKGCLRHLDYKELGRFPLWIMPFNLPKIMAAQKSKQGMFWRIAARAANPFFHLEQAALRPGDRKSCVTEKIPEFGAEFNEFWETVKEGYTNILVRNRDFLNWRFVGPPTRRYDIFAARSEGRLLGYLVGSISSIEGLRWGVIVDMLTAGTSDGEAASKQLVASFTRYIRAEGADLAAALMFKHAPAAKALRRNGYIICPQRLLPRDFPVLLRWNMPGPAPAGLFDLRAWYMTLGDYDAV